MTNVAIHIPAAVKDFALSGALATAKAATTTDAEEAYRRGRADGEKSLQSELLTQRNEIIGLQRGLFDALREAIPQMIQQGERELVQIALNVARKLVDDLPVSPEMVNEAVRRALAGVESGAGCEVLLHPDDLELLNRFDSSSVGGNPALRLSASPEISRGGCVVKSPFGTIDAQRETKFRQIGDSLIA